MIIRATYGAGLIVFCVAVSSWARLLAQAPQTTTPPGRMTLRSSIDLVPVDVNVIDKNGRPVAGLGVDDFALTIDGRQRKLASAEFVSIPPAAASRTAPADYSSNADVVGGRLVVLAIDAGNIESGRGKPALAAASRFLERLNPADRVALATLPGGPQVDFTSNHAAVQKLVQASVGQGTPNNVTTRLGLGEALAIERGDESVVTQVVDQQCPGDTSASARDSCLQQLTQEANLLLADARERSRRSIGALRSLFDRLGTSETPKTIVLLSEGLLLEPDYADVAWIGPRASAAHVTLYVLQIDTPDMDAGTRRAATRSQDRDALRQGLDVMAGMARGDVFRVVANADFAFRRLALELSGYYLLSFEAQPGDRDDRPHKIKVDVRKKDVEVRARREFSVPAAPSAPSRDELLDALRAPLLARDIPLKLTTYAFQDANSAKIKIIVAASLERAIDTDAGMAVGYLVFDETGKVVANQVERRLATPVSPRTKAQTYVGSVLAAPGVYTVKLAAVDTTGRRGSVERTFTADTKSIGQLRVTDLLIADNSEPGASGLTPTVDATFAGDELQTYLELFADPAVIAKAAVTIEITENGGARALENAPARVDIADGNERRRVAQAGLPIAQLPAGDYVARAVVAVEGETAGTVSRPFRIVRPPKAMKGVGGFDRMTVLAQPVIGLFLDRLTAAAPNAAAFRPAMDDVRGGRFSEAMKSLDASGDDELATAFLKGLVLLSQGELNPAANKFRDALRIDSEFYPAAFYLGACYAAGGRDREAAGAWQTSLIAEADAPFIYTMLADALLRLREPAQAVDVLNEARSKWPDDQEIAARLATALALKKGSKH